MTSNNKDRIYLEANNGKKFAFDRKVSLVFDDMIARSVPGYRTIQRLLVWLGAHLAVEHSSVCDIGCSTGYTLRLMDDVLDDRIKLIGYDSSEPMLQRCREKLSHPPTRRTVELYNHDFNQSVPDLHQPSVVIMALVLQFIPPEQRARLLREIFRQLHPRGALLLVEKIVDSNPRVDKLYSRWYYEFKQRQGYSQTEIARKKEALENVLVPQTIDEHRRNLEHAGFVGSHLFYSQANFCGILALKSNDTLPNL